MASDNIQISDKLGEQLIDNNVKLPATNLVLRETIAEADTEAFTLSTALNGNIVCVPGTNFKGQLTRQENNVYSLTVNGVRYSVSSDGIIQTGEYAGKQLALVDSTLKGVQGDIQTRAGTGGSEQVSISSMNPRDEFAMTALKVIMEKQKSPESVSDGTIQLCCEAAYRWAQGMLEASAKARKVYKEEEPSKDAVDVNVETLNNNSDKILYNVNDSLKSLNTTLKGTLKIDNPTNDKFEINGGGGEGGWPSKDKLLQVSTNNISSIIAFNGNAAGYADKSSIVDIAKTDNLWARSYENGDKFIESKADNIKSVVSASTDDKITTAINQLISDYGLTKA